MWVIVLSYFPSLEVLWALGNGSVFVSEVFSVCYVIFSPPLSRTQFITWIYSILFIAGNPVSWCSMIYKPEVHQPLQTLKTFDCSVRRRERWGIMKSLERALLWISGWNWEWAKDGRCSFILSDTPGIPCSHLCHFRSALASLTERLINHDNNVFLLFSPHLPALGQITFFESQQVRLKLGPPACPAKAGNRLLFNSFNAVLCCCCKKSRIVPFYKWTENHQMLEKNLQLCFISVTQ